MSDEEKKAIRDLIDSNNLSLIGDGTIITSRETIETVLNLIEKQSKEIEESEQKEKQAYIKGTNDAHELCNKMWKDKIKAKIEFIKSLREKIYYEENVISILESLLYKGVDKNENRR